MNTSHIFAARPSAYWSRTGGDVDISSTRDCIKLSATIVGWVLFVLLFGAMAHTHAQYLNQIIHHKIIRLLVLCRRHRRRRRLFSSLFSFSISDFCFCCLPINLALSLSRSLAGKTSLLTFTCSNAYEFYTKRIRTLSRMLRIISLHWMGRLTVKRLKYYSHTTQSPRTLDAKTDTDTSSIYKHSFTHSVTHSHPLSWYVTQTER